MLKRTVGRKRWIALCILVAGVMLVQVPRNAEVSSVPRMQHKVSLQVNSGSHQGFGLQVLIEVHHFSRQART